LFTPLFTSSYQHAYGNVYTTPSDFYSATYATGIDTLMPATVAYPTLFQDGKLPELALFDSTTPVVTVPNDPTLSAQLTAELAVPNNAFAAGFGSPYLVNNSARVSYILDLATDPDGTETGSAQLAPAAPTYGVRLDAYKNDLRNGSWAPNSPTLMCGGENDPTVFFSLDTLTMAAFWSGLPAGLVNVLDVDPAGGPSGPFAPIQAGFQQSQAQELAFLQTPAGGGLSLAAAEQAVEGNYHGGSALISFCSLAARTFFSSL